MGCPSCGASVERGSRFCDQCGVVFETQLTDEMVSGKGKTKHLEYAFVAQVAQSAGLPATVLPAPAGVAAQGHVTQPGVRNSGELPATNYVPMDGCRSCGAKLRPGTKFCASCGTSVTPSELAQRLQHFQRGLKAVPLQARHALTESSISFIGWIALGFTALCVAGAGFSLLTGGGEGPGLTDQARLLPYLRSILWLLLGVISALGGLYAKKKD